MTNVPRVHQPDTARQPGLSEIDRAGCLRLLASAQVGRVIYTEAAMPAAHPVNYCLDAEEVVFRTGGGGKLAAAARGIVVGFQGESLAELRRALRRIHVPESQNDIFAARHRLGRRH